jgi:Helix-turn-helix domain
MSSRSASSVGLPAEPLTGIDAVFLTAAEAAAFLRVSAVTLGRWRIEGCGPHYRKFGRRVVYARCDLIAWTEAQRRQSTSEPDHRIGNKV